MSPSSAGPLERRTAIVTGSAGALGRAFAVCWARAGGRVALVDVNDAANQETARLVEAAGGEALCEICDVRSPEAWRTLHDKLRALWPRLDLLVNNAGVAGAGEVGEFPLDDWQWLLDTNLKSVVVGCHTFVPWLKENPTGASIVNVASLAGFAALPNMAAYNVAKAGVMTLSETLRTELSPTKVGVTVVCPGFFKSGLADSARMLKPEQRDFTLERMNAAGFTADDVARLTLKAARRNKPYVIVPARARILWWIKRFSPSLYLRLISARYKSHLAQEQANSSRR